MRKVYIALIVFSVGLFFSCQNNDSSEDSQSSAQTAKPVKLTKSQLKIVNTNNAFAFNLFGVLSEICPGDNLLYSPLGIQSVLSMMLNGANGDTYSQIVAALGYEDYTLEDINGLYSLMLDDLLKMDNNVHFSVANGVWLNNITIKEQLRSTLQTYYGPIIKKTDFSLPETVNSINDWCSKNTNGMIDSIVEELNTNSLALFLNALCFEGEWCQKFDSSRTVDGKFYLAGGQSVDKPFMHMNAFLSASEVDGDIICTLSFGRSRYQFYIVLPSGQNSFQQFISSFNESKYRALLDSRQLYDVQLSLPKISIDCEMSDALSRALKSLGVVDAFNINTADFSNLFTSRVSIGTIKQKAFFEIDENGARFSTLTSGELSVGEDSLFEPEKIEIDVNRPFIFMISESNSDAVLLMGSYVK